MSKSRFALCLFVAWLGSALYANMALAQDQKAPKLKTIWVRAYPGWFLDILPDGSGTVQYGALPLDCVQFKAGTIDAPAAAARLAKAMNQKSGFSVAITTVGNDGKEAKTFDSTDDSKLVLELFGKALQKEASTFRGGRIDQVLKERPPAAKPNGE